MLSVERQLPRGLRARAGRIRAPITGPRERAELQDAASPAERSCVQEEIRGKGARASRVVGDRLLAELAAIEETRAPMTHCCGSAWRGKRRGGGAGRGLGAALDELARRGGDRFLEPRCC